MVRVRPIVWLGAALIGFVPGLGAPQRVGAQPGASETPPPATSGASLGNLHGFADIGAGVTSGDGGSGFSNGSLDFYLTPQLSTRVKSLVELVFEYDAEGALMVDLERLQVGYTFGDAATVWLGRFHTPIGFWNTAYHHGRQIQTSATRPRFVDFEDAGGILPVHTVGTMLTGSQRVGSGRVFYDLFAGNAPRILDGTLDPQNVAGPDNTFGGGFNLAYRPGPTDAWPRFGVHVYRAASRRDEVPGAGPARFVGAYVARESETWELLGEYYRFLDPGQAGGARPASWAGFVQLATRMGEWTPYLRLERLSVDSSDLFLTSQTSGTSYRQAVAGLRFDLTSAAALKVELSRQRDADAGGETSMLLQWAIRF